MLPLRDPKDRPADFGRAVPIACSLSAGEARKRVARWNALVLDAKTSTHVQAGLVQATFRNEAAVQNEVRQLVDAERECCPFLHFDVSESETAVILTITPLNASGDEDLALLAAALGIIS